MKVIQRNGVDIFVTSSITMKDTNLDRDNKLALRLLANASMTSNAHSLFNGRAAINYGGSRGKIAGNPTGSQ